MASTLNTHMMASSNANGKESRSPQFPAGNASLLLEKTKMGLRRSTPDSEALASSDDEQDATRHMSRMTSQPLPRPARRPSWINDSARTANLKSSIGATGLAGESHSPAHTPDGTGWGSASSPLARVASNGNSFPWGNAIWSSEGTKNPPARLAEMMPNGSEEPEHGSTYDEPLRSPGLRRDSNAGGSIPFAIPLKPTLKAYRSQSYSVGQMEQELSEANQTRQQSFGLSGRTRAGTSYGGLQQRGSRPSMIGEYSHDGGVLEQLREVDDDEESFNSSEAQQNLSSESRSREQLERENELLRENNELRQQIANLNLSGQREGSWGLGEQPRGYDGRRSTFSETVLEDHDDGSLLGDEAMSSGHYAVPLARGGRRMSEYNGGTFGYAQHGNQLSNRAIEIVKRNHWQSSLGFGSVSEQPQSRRHSFAEAPKRQMSFGSIGSDHPGNEAGRISQNALSNDLGYPSSSQYRQQRTMTPQELSAQSISGQAYSSSQPRYSGQLHGFESMSLRSQSLYMVTFKASRAEFYYVPQGVGLEIKAGDLVIVEADRGTDLGTVVQVNVPWAQTRSLKEHYAEEHYRWLMMSSRRRAEGAALGPNPGAASVGSPGSREHALTKEESDIKPKMIKRLAQAHEIQNLKDKEANEAKAKRICQVKADEHQLDMEILDAEFQMDWKKLTFYYYADTYINFNSLVTDLFKTYKTRIWMSAINPASFMTPNSGIAPPSLISPGAILSQADPRNISATAMRSSPQTMSRSGLGGPAGNGVPNDMLQYWAAQHHPLQGSVPYYDKLYSPQDEAEFQRYGNTVRTTDFGVPVRQQQGQQGFNHQNEGQYGTGIPQSMYGGLGMNGNGVY